MTLSIPVTAPPWPGLGKRIESQTRKALYEFKLLENADGITVALSGGKDSLTLLFMLKAIIGRGFPDLPIHAVHITGAFSCGAGIQLDYLYGICEALDVNLIVRETHQSLDTLECYSCSRKRRSLIFEAAQELGATTIAFGHHRDDNVQTTLMNLLHKGEFKGNLPKVPMHKYGITIIRPLIFVSEQQIRTFAEQQSFARVMCRCPVGQNSQRRKVEELLQQIESLYPDARDQLARAVMESGSQGALDE